MFISCLELIKIKLLFLMIPTASSPGNVVKNPFEMEEKNARCIFYFVFLCR